ncbi:MAG: TlpA family protein disulfide reductase [Muribaculaceae bacterium]|nr:TlpA family protein disulfide reductase [Muribaculaceae bacterium]
MKLLKSIICLLAATIAIPSAQAALPSVKLKDLKGRVVDTATLNNGNKPMIISFFSGGCKPCKRELNAINEVYDDWRDETGVKLVAISIDKAQDASKVKPFVDAEGWDYDILLDPNSDFMRAMGIQKIPHLLIIDGNGKIVESRSGYTDGSESHIIEKLRSIVSASKSAKSKKK